MNALEGTALAIALAGTAVYLAWWRPRWPSFLAACCLMSLPLYLSLERSTQFLTTDEIGAVDEPIQGTTGNWDCGALRTTDAVLGPTISQTRRLLDRLGVSLSPADLPPTLKAAKWMLCCFCAMLIFEVLRRHWLAGPARHTATAFVLFSYWAFAFPTNNMALKIFHYDSLSLLLSVLALLLVAVAIVKSSAGHAVAAVAVAFLAAQEKLIASPVLLLALVTLVYVALAGAHGPRAMVARSLLACLLGFGASLGIALLSGVLFAARRGFEVPAGFWWHLVDPLVSWGWVPMRFVFGMEDFGYQSGLMLAAVVVLVPVCGVLAAMVARGWGASPRRWVHGASYARWAFLAGCVAALGAGIVAFWLVTPCWGPVFPVPPGAYTPPGEMNGLFLHFSAPDRWSHLLCSIGYSYTVFAFAVPTIFWIALAPLGIAWCRQRNTAWPDTALALLGLGGLLMPLAVGAMLIPVGHRYMNIGLAILGLAIVTALARVIRTWRPAWRYSLVACFCGALVLEILPFRPCYFPFRPIWVSYPDSDFPVAGRINPSWLGWGEELMLVAQELERELDRLPASARKPLTVYHTYRGRYMNKNSLVNGELLSVRQVKAFSYSKDAFVLVNRSMVCQGLELPVGVEPVHVLRFRGFAQAWLYRADQLRGTNFARLYLFDARRDSPPPVMTARAGKRPDTGNQ